MAHLEITLNEHRLLLEGYQVLFFVLAVWFAVWAGTKAYLFLSNKS